MNNKTDNWKLNKIGVLRSIQGMQDMSFPRVQISIFFPGEHAPEPTYIIRAFRADSTLVSPVTLVLNVRLQKTPYLDKMNDDTEKLVQNLHNSGWKQKFELQRNYTKQDLSCSKTGNITDYSTHFAAMLQNKLPAFCCPFYHELRSQ